MKCKKRKVAENAEVEAENAEVENLDEELSKRPLIQR